MTSTIDGLALVEREDAEGRTRLALVDHSNGFSRDACSLTIDRLELHDGAGGLLRVDGIGNVATLESHRRRGLATQLLEVAIERMRDGGAAASLLYGIDGFYEPLGWRSCGDERWVHVELDAWRSAHVGGTSWREMRSADLPAMRLAYERIAAGVAGAVSRESSRAWSRIEQGEVHVVERDGGLVGWCWRGVGIGERDSLESQPGVVAFAELQAVDDDAMPAVLDVAVELARRDERIDRPRVLVTGADERHALRRLARAGRFECRLVDEVRPRGGAMLLPLDEHGTWLAGLGGLYQFLPDRF